MLDKIKDINHALRNKSYLSALALSLTLPDICGKIEYPHFKHKNGKRDVGKQYATWFENWVDQFFADNTGWIKDYTKAKNPYFTGRMCYSLRCSFLHDGNSDIGSWGDKEDAEFYYSYDFELALGEADSIGLSWVNQASNNSKITKTKTVRVNIDKLCKSICQAAENYYQEKDPILFKDHKINFLDFTSFQTR
ncbi:hypothetical protein BN988_02825 [Oceanobacillus picturae]|uniref:Uncharacterized protein n=1 Tax=Oceanobacillus picturae TaxID=171693 RepID=W9ANQ9_9BACI|nr:hypothetical protein [Oceanobacillus picturae]CDO04271.1 hypothetical protein BN988_02825 [Oceanobacillus picturae]